MPLGQGRGATAQLPGIILGTALAEKLKVHVGDAVSVAAAAAGTAGVPRLRRFVVVGEFSSGMPEYDSGLAYISLADAQRLYDMDGSVTGIEIKVRDLYQANHVAEQLAGTLGIGYRVRDWMAANKNLFAALTLQKTVYFDRPAADHARRRVHRAGDAGHGGDGEAQGHRDPQVDGRAAAAASAASSSSRDW